MLEIKNLGCTASGVRILDEITLEIAPGSFTAILGRNGSGKSTLAAHMNALRVPDCGTVTVDGMDTANEKYLYRIRERVGMVFQNPDSQSVAAILEDDTAFAPENLGLEPEETLARVDAALEACGIAELRGRAISALSGGQKQLAAIAGILAMRPKYMVFDEATSMLDPRARKRVLDCVRRLRRELGIAVVWITHYMDEAALSDRCVILKSGKIIGDGAPRKIFADRKLIADAGLELPECVKQGLALKDAGVYGGELPLTVEEFGEIIKCVPHAKAHIPLMADAAVRFSAAELRLNNISYTYRSPEGDTTALSVVTETIRGGCMTAVAGRTGSGKSTLAAVLAALIQPDSGSVTYNGHSIDRKKVGIVFQYPEYQLFADTVYNDIAFAPQNFGMSGTVLDRAVRRAAERVGLDECLLAASPFTLSGGERRMAAIAGVIAAEPEILILDEPAAGLDPAGRTRIFALLSEMLRDNTDMIVVFITHSMDDAVRYAGDMLLLDRGKIAAHAAPRKIFADKSLLDECGIDTPDIIRLSEILERKERQTDAS